MHKLSLVPILLLLSVQLAWANQNTAAPLYTALEPEAVRPLARQKSTVCIDVRVGGERRGQVNVDHPDGEWYLKCHRTVQAPFDGSFNGVDLRSYRSQPVKLVVYCQVGKRSDQAARYLVQTLGFPKSKVYAVDGGLDLLDFDKKTRRAVHGRPPTTMMTGG